jgi:EF-P beta-lysylation protein EpmB
VADWQSALKAAVRDAKQLCQFLDLPLRYQAAAVQAARQFPVFAPWEYIGRMKPGDPRDPLLRQVLPLTEELESAPGFQQDPVHEQAATRQPGLLQKYAGRALMITTGACAVHCRYCFRRHFPYGERITSTAAWAACLNMLAQEPDIDEVILSGGDPLTLTDGRLAALIGRLGQIDHLQRLRIHTRLPVVIPQRVTSTLVTSLTQSRLTPVMVLHVNHPSELDEPTSEALRRLVDAGIPTLNQAVLLRGVNDDADTLEQLCRQLVNRRVMPYYLHQLDRVAGAAHFEVPESLGRALIAQLHSRLPGYAVPRYVREVAGQPGKTVLA